MKWKTDKSGCSSLPPWMSLWVFLPFVISWISSSFSSFWLIDFELSKDEFRCGTVRAEFFQISFPVAFTRCNRINRGGRWVDFSPFSLLDHTFILSHISFTPFNLGNSILACLSSIILTHSGSLIPLFEFSRSALVLCPNNHLTLINKSEAVIFLSNLI